MGPGNLGLVYNEIVNKKAGFTLIELMIVMGLIMILGTVGLGTFSSAVVKSKDSQRKSDLGQIVKALESFNTDVGRYPLSLEGEDFIHCYISLAGAVANPSCDGDKLYSEVNGAMTTYITIPSDVDPYRKYVYISDDGSGYSLYAALEYEQDKDLLRDEDGALVLDPWGVSCGSVSCNYQLSETGLVKNL